MAKVEIELSEIERMNSEISEQKEEIARLVRDVNQFDKKKLQSQAVELSKFLFDNYIRSVFEHLGFDQGDESVKFPDNLYHYLGQNWWSSPRIKFNIGASISKQWRDAFLSIGIIPDKDVCEKKLDEFDKFFES